MDRSGDRTQKTQTLLKIPDPGTGKRVSVQCVRVETETLGTSTEPEFVRTTGENLVPKSTHEKQKKHAKTGGPTTKQQ